MIRVDGVEIPDRAIAAEMQHHPAPTREAAWHAAAQALVVRQLLLAEAERRGFGGAEEEAVSRLLAAEIAVPEADEATCRRWYEANRGRFRSQEAWHAQHLLIAADPEDAEARRSAEAEARALLAEVQADPDRLGPLARERSACPSREQGGDLGLVEPGTTVPEFEAALRALAPGGIHPTPVATRFGFHVLRLLRHEPGRELPYETVAPRIAAWLREASWRRAVHQYIALLARRARIEGFSLDHSAADGPLVQ
ncbi:peptidylprolyl isomerase [Caldovatus aquaticus]|uniref:Parvulin-like PPIase n=1 Tax=Caldovatus aquaticus TaxID=2865671 RepID=A0ABS7F237_9PROT|nr:peptidylprolyl isomerase [Caldovatus aquaticus]MBW8268866.1 peptidyl-prolyl cis-trans isomerase [Caldovatus aquaticus]